MTISLIVDSRYKEYTLKDGRRFVIDNYRDAILRDGYHGLSPKTKDLWRRTVKQLIENEFNGNILFASEVLLEVYNKPEYELTPRMKKGYNFERLVWRELQGLGFEWAWTEGLGRRKG